VSLAASSLTGLGSVKTGAQAPAGGGGTGDVESVTGAAPGIVDNSDPDNPVILPQFGEDTTIQKDNGASVPKTILELIASTAIGGSTIGDLDAAFVTRVANRGPQALWLEVGVNDVNLTHTSLVDYAAAWESVMSKCDALGLDVWALSILCYTEAWAETPLRWAGQYDVGALTPPTINDYNAAAKAIVEAHGGTWVDARAAYLAQEPATNPTSNPIGAMTFDGVHPTAAGKALLSATLLGQITVAARQ
jgi:lysophospholipase L1-like esterase